MKLRIDSLVKDFGSFDDPGGLFRAVDSVSLEVDDGELVTLLGPSGCGKTTLLRMITGIFYPDSGEILLNGKKFNPVNDVRNIGYMPEERGLYKKMRVGEQLIYLAQLKGLSYPIALEKVKHWLQKLNMTEWWNKKIEELSKGMQQKVQFVATVAHNPKLLILDEPFTGLDPLNADLLKEEIYKLNQQGVSILWPAARQRYRQHSANIRPSSCRTGIPSQYQ